MKSKEKMGKLKQISSRLHLFSDGLWIFKILNLFLQRHVGVCRVYPLFESSAVILLPFKELLLLNKFTEGVIEIVQI